MDSALVIENIRKRYDIAPETPVGIWSNVKANAEAFETRDSKPAIKGIATTDDVDADDEVVMPEGIDTASYLMANRKYFVDHRYDVRNTIGVIRSMNPFPTAKAGAQRGWQYVAELTFGLGAGLAEDVYTIAKAGGIGTSIAFKALDWGSPTADEKKKYPRASSVVRKSVAVELSATAMPCNVACQSGAMTIDEKRLGILDGLVTKSLISRESAMALAPEFSPKAVTIVFLS